MARVRLKRFRVREPSEQAQAHYIRSYSGRDLHFRPHELPPLTSEELFGVSAPLILDLGCGRGEFLVRQAQERPTDYFVGLDWHRKSIWDAVNRAQAAGVDNVRFVRADFRQALRLVPDGAAAEVYLLFPPPILKRSKRKQDPLPEKALHEIHRVLTVGGVFHFVTDSAPYFRAKLEWIAGTGLFALEAEAHGFEGGQTRFQRFWESFAIPTHRAVLRKGRREPRA